LGADRRPPPRRRRHRRRSPPHSQRGGRRALGPLSPERARGAEGAAFGAAGERPKPTGSAGRTLRRGLAPSPPTGLVAPRSRGASPGHPLRGHGGSVRTSSLARADALASNMPRRPFSPFTPKRPWTHGAGAPAPATLCWATAAPFA